MANAVSSSSGSPTRGCRVPGLTPEQCTQLFELLKSSTLSLFGNSFSLCFNSFPSWIINSGVIYHKSHLPINTTTRPNNFLSIVQLQNVELFLCIKLIHGYFSYYSFAQCSVCSSSFFNLFSVSKLTQSLNSVTIFFLPSLLGLRDKDADWSG